MDPLASLISEAQRAFAAALQPAALENEKARFLGKGGSLTELLKGMGKLAAKARASMPPRRASRNCCRRAATSWRSRNWTAGWPPRPST